MNIIFLFNEVVDLDFILNWFKNNDKSLGLKIKPTCVIVKYFNSLNELR